jgi:hypothetical protein
MLNCDASEVIYCDDVEQNLVEPKAMGMETILVFYCLFVNYYSFT